MKCFLLALFIALSLHAEAQTIKPETKFTLKELITIASSDNEYFDTYVVNKGFEFNNAKTKDGLETIQYDYGASSNREYDTQAIVKKNCEYFNSCNWCPSKVNAYNAIKNELKAQGFIFIEKKVDEENGGISFNYKKGNITVTLRAYPNATSSGSKVTDYGIYVYKYH